MNGVVELSTQWPPARSIEILQQHPQQHAGVEKFELPKYGRGAARPMHTRAASASISLRVAEARA
jgi:hypothetical protein